MTTEKFANGIVRAFMVIGILALICLILTYIPSFQQTLIEKTQIDQHGIQLLQGILAFLAGASAWGLANIFYQKQKVFVGTLTAIYGFLPFVIAVYRFLEAFGIMEK